MSDPAERPSKVHLSLADLTDEERAMLPKNGQSLEMFLTLIGTRRLALQRKRAKGEIERDQDCLLYTSFALDRGKQGGTG